MATQSENNKKDLEVVKRLLRYVSYDTQSKDESNEVPSTAKQFDLAKVLKEELETIGASDVRLTDHCYVYAKIPSNLEEQAEGKKVPAIGFIAHMDTATALTGKDVKPQIIENYDGGVIKLGESGYSMGPNEFPELAGLKGKSLITTDGTTLLGADDKAGVAEIMTMAAYFLAHPEVKHGDICIAFTPDEEVGNGVEYFDVPGFGADFAYTVDGGAVGEIEYENFNAANLRIEVQGYGIHPGSAKGKMKNSIRMAMELEQMLTVFDNPEYTDGYEGFHHLGGIEGDTEHTTMHYIVRDHDAGKLERKLEEIDKAAEYLNFKYGEGSVQVVRLGSYQNMKEMILPHMHLIENAKEAMAELGLNPQSVPIRGGTDGARLSFMGLPCPNLCTGGANYHGRFEYACIEQMEQCVEILKKIVEKYATMML